MTNHEYSAAAVGPIARSLAGLLGALLVWAVVDTLLSALLGDGALGEFGITGFMLLLFGPLAALLFVRAAWTGNDALSDADLWALAGAAESCGPPAAPPSSGQPENEGRALSAREWDELDGWWRDWLEAGVEIDHPQHLSPAQRAAFDEAYGKLVAARIPYPMPALLCAEEFPGETARMQLALELPQWLEEAQRGFVASGTLRRALRREELAAFLPGVVEVWRQAPDLEHDQMLYYLLARDRPALLTDPWAARRFAREMDAYLAVDPG